MILGCTHYPLVRPMLQRMLGRGVEIVTSGAPLARQVEHVLGARGLGNPAGGEGDYRFLCTGDVEAFRALGTRFLQMPLGAVEHVDLRAEGGGMSARERSGGRAAGRAAAGHDRAGLRPHRDRLGADLLRRDARDLHRLGPGVRPALDGGQGPRLGDGRVRDAPGLDRRPQAARRHARAAPTGARSRSSA